MLTTQRNVSVATLNQALSTLLLWDRVLAVQLPWLPSPLIWAALGWFWLFPAS
ncbi:hypothetical protein [Rhodoferax fermentans]|nr:hypothetical protein [Rhodoferax fermentans]